MRKRESFYLVAVSLVVIFTTAGCAKQDVVKKDEGIAPARKVETPKPDVTPQAQSAATPVMPAAATEQSSQNVSSIAQLQSALNKIYFNFDSSDLSKSARDTLTKNAVPLTKEPAAKIRIEGNCDERGSAEYNLALGERRAKAAQQYLVTLGIKPERISTISYGKEKPAVHGNDEAAWSKNRRDEFVVVTP